MYKSSMERRKERLYHYFGGMFSEDFLDSILTYKAEPQEEVDQVCQEIIDKFKIDMSDELF